MSTRRALFFSFLDRYSGLVLSVISSMVIARLLEPEEIGVFSVAMALLAFAATLRDMGAGQYVVQAQEVTSELLKAVWTIQFSLGATLGLLVAALAYPVAAFYSEPRIAPIMGVMALTYLVTPVGSITYALLMREMRFQHVAVMRFTSSVVGSVVAIGLAYQGFGPISLAWSLLAASISTALAAQFYRQPGQPWGFSFLGARKVLGFGGLITGTSFINTLVQGMPDFALGKLQGMTAAGLYSRSNGLVMIFHRLVTDAMYGVALAHFAKSIREGADPLPDLQRAMQYLVMLNVTFAVVLCAVAEPLTHVLYGDQWDASIPLTRWIAFASILWSIAPICSAVIAANGRADSILKVTLLSGAVTITAVLIGSAHGMYGVGIALSISSLATSLIFGMAVQKIFLFWSWLTAMKIIHAVATGLIAATPTLAIMWIYGFSFNNQIIGLTLIAALQIPSVYVAGTITNQPISQDISRIIGGSFKRMHELFTKKTAQS